jgi:chromosome segregation ATPase
VEGGEEESMQLDALITADEALRDAHEQIKGLRLLEKERLVLQSQLEQANRELSELKVKEMMNRGSQQRRDSAEAGSFDGEIAKMMVQRAKEELDDAKAALQASEAARERFQEELAMLRDLVADGVGGGDCKGCEEAQGRIGELEGRISELLGSDRQKSGRGGGEGGVEVGWLEAQLNVTMRDVTNIGGCMATLDCSAGDRPVLMGLQTTQGR